MERNPRDAVLGNEMLLGEILHRMPSSKSFIRCSSTSKLWLATAKSRAVVDLFLKKNTQCCLGFIVETKKHGDRSTALQMLFQGGAPEGESMVSMRSGFDLGALRRLPIVATDGPMVLQAVEVPGDWPVGYHVSCPFSRPGDLRYVGHLIPKIPRDPEQHTRNTFGQFGVLMRTGKEDATPMGFFVKDFATPPASLYEGVRFASSSVVYVHVCVFKLSEWHRFVSQPIQPPPLATFHRNPYCILVGKLLFMMYLLDFIVCFNLDTCSFLIVNLPGEVSQTATSWFDFSVAKGTNGGLALVHNDKGMITKWTLDAQTDLVNWKLETRFNISATIGGSLHFSIHELLLDVAIDWGSVQLRCASQDARFVLVTLGMNEGLFIVDMLKKTVLEMPNMVEHGQLGRAFQLGENWPPVL